MSKFGDFMGSSLGMGAAGLGLGALSQGVGALFSYFNQKDAEKQLDALNKQKLPRYSINPAVSRIYGGAVRGVAQPQGFTGGQRAMYNQDIAQGINTQYNNARSMGGGSLSRAISGSLAGNRLNAYNQMAGQDAQLARQYQNAAYSRMLGATNTMQSLQNQNTNVDLNRRLRQEELLGQAISSQRDYRRGMLGSFGSELTSAGLAGIFSGNKPDDGDGGGGGGLGRGNSPYEGVLPATRDWYSRNRARKY